MKTFLVLVLIAVVGWAGWHWLAGKNTTVSVNATESPSPEQTLPGLGGQGPEPAGYTDDESASQTSVPVAVTSPHTTTPARTATPRPVASRTPTPSSAPVVAFRSLSALNGSGENGVMSITSAENGNAVINFNMDGMPAGVQQPVYIYSGESCQGSEHVAWGLNPMVNGSGMTILPIKASDLIRSNGTLYLVVQQSTSNNTRVSCAAL